MQIFIDILDFLFSKNCPFCGELNSDNYICEKCYSQLEFLQLCCDKCQQPMSVYSNYIKICPKCNSGYEFYNKMRSPLNYNNFLKQQILRFKNNNGVYLSNIFAQLIFLKAKDLFDSHSIITPVPLFKNRVSKRGYNQSAFISKKLAKIANIEYIPDLILRVKDTTSQAGKSSKERYENVKEAFILNSKYDLNGKTIFILDDIITTGATIFECARVIKNVKEVNLLSLGRRIIQ